MRSIKSRLSGTGWDRPPAGPAGVLGALRGQGVEPELGVVGLAAPAVLVLGAVVDEQEHAGGGQALDQAVEHGLGLGIDPVQVLEDQQQRLHLTLAQQQPLDGVEGALAALRRIEACQPGCPRPARPGARGRPAGSAEGLVQGEELAGDLLTDVRASSRSSIWE